MLSQPREYASARQVLEEVHQKKRHSELESDVLAKLLLSETHHVCRLVVLLHTLEEVVEALATLHWDVLLVSGEAAMAHIVFGGLVHDFFVGCCVHLRGEDRQEIGLELSDLGFFLKVLVDIANLIVLLEVVPLLEGLRPTRAHELLLLQLVHQVLEVLVECIYEQRVIRVFDR